MPKLVARRLEKLQKDFLWGGANGENKAHLVKWEANGFGDLRVPRRNFGKKCLRLSMGKRSLGGGQGRQMGCLELEFGRKSEGVSLVLGKYGVQGADFPHSKIWVDKVPTKIAFFAWEATWGKVLTLDRLQRRGWQFPNRCFLCGCEEETINHILIHCTMAKGLWDIILALCGVQWVKENSGMQNISGIPQNSVGNSMGQGVPSNMFANSQRQSQGRPQVVPQQQQQQSQSSQQYIYQQQLQHHLLKTEVISNSSSSRLCYNQISSNRSQQSVMQTSSGMQSAPLSGLQQNQPSSVQQSSQSVLQQHPPAVLRQQQQPQQTPQQQQQQQQRLLSQQNNLPNLQQQQQQQQAPVDGSAEQPFEYSSANSWAIKVMFLHCSSSNKCLELNLVILVCRTNQHPVHIFATIQRFQFSNKRSRVVSNLLATQGQQSQQQPITAATDVTVSITVTQLQPQPNSLQRDMQQRLQTSGALLQTQNVIDQQKQLFQSQRALPEASSSMLL
ncbi:hypothetical protein CK203_113738 [Vitis vinifera]|uniref:Reverse transcriptase zinc-binding domain-containing protein n=1 Tax=Vitis vinifera TaxID=29760 RepID=A0A438DN30_VITVI|nr:hypothetical protein CK203_113738 [Vitis vinifera]